MAALVYGLGDPVLDVVARVSHELLQRLGAEAGGCVQVSAQEMGRLLALPEVAASMMRVPGGSAANVMKGLASLAAGGAGAQLRVAFVGMVGADAVGLEYRSSIASHGITPLLLESSSGAPTATCLCLVTPDGQRTMRTSLGAALELSSPQQLPAQLGGAADAPTAAAASPGAGTPPTPPAVALLHCEGYSLYRPAVAATAMRAVRAAGGRVSLDLASFEALHRCWGALESLLGERLVDTVFCNEQEAGALCQAAGLALPPGGGSPEQQVAAAQQFLQQRGVGTVVVSRGSKGCIATSAGSGTAATAAAQVPVVDTVGAGDYFSVGTLYALLSGASLEACTRCGCTAGTAAVGVAGAELGPAALQQLRADIGAILGADAAATGNGAAAAAEGQDCGVVAAASTWTRACGPAAPIAPARACGVLGSRQPAVL